MASYTYWEAKETYYYKLCFPIGPSIAGAFAIIDLVSVWRPLTEQTHCSAAFILDDCRFSNDRAVCSGETSSFLSSRRSLDRTERIQPRTAGFQAALLRLGGWVRRSWQWQAGDQHVSRLECHLSGELAPSQTEVVPLVQAAWFARQRCRAEPHGEGRWHAFGTLHAKKYSCSCSALRSICGLFELLRTKLLA